MILLVRAVETEGLRVERTVQEVASLTERQAWLQEERQQRRTELDEEILKAQLAEAHMLQDALECHSVEHTEMEGQRRLAVGLREARNAQDGRQVEGNVLPAAENLVRRASQAW